MFIIFSCVFYVVLINLQCEGYIHFDEQFAQCTIYYIYILVQHEQLLFFGVFSMKLCVYVEFYTLHRIGRIGRKGYCIYSYVTSANIVPIYHITYIISIVRFLLFFMVMQLNLSVKFFTLPPQILIQWLHYII